MLVDFYVGAKGQVRSYCKKCHNRRDADYRRTLRGNVSVLVNSARQRSKMKGKDFNLDADFILDLILYQQGRCAYSGVDMEMLLPHSDWRMSLERVNNAVGYVAENCVLIAAEFNTAERISRRATVQAAPGSSKWSPEKVQNLRSERLLNVDLQNLDKLIQAARMKYQSLAPPTNLISSPCDFQEGGCGLQRCSRCGLWKPLESFYLRSSRSCRTQLRSTCKQCVGEYNFWRRMTLRGHVQGMLWDACRRHNRGKWHGNFDLDLDSVLQMLWSQQGRCFYSNVPLCFAQLNVDWMMSLERLDNSKTYTKDNTVLVALEFNTTDHTSRAVYSVVGSSQWSRSKVERVWGILQDP